MSKVKYFICPMSKNIVDAVLSLNDKRVGLLPSRRQVDYNGGYVGWTTEDFCRYVGSRVYIERDHAGAGQGDVLDDGKLSYSKDANHIPLIHVDPWKTVKTKEEGLQKTIEDIKFIHDLNANTKFEVGTEESIFPFSTDDLEWFVCNLETSLGANLFDLIEFVVIQSGVNLDVVNEQNIGIFDAIKLKKEIEICSKFGKKTKEHNGDFLSSTQRRVRFETGLSAINIGPEISIFENKLYMDYLSPGEFQKLSAICYDNGAWKKWVGGKDIDMNTVFRISAHYSYEKMQLPDVNAVESIKNKLLSILDYE